MNQEDQGLTPSSAKTEPCGQVEPIGESQERGAWRSLSEREMIEVKHAALGGDVAARRWNDALNALHAFAQASGCEPGRNVTRWFTERSEAYHEALKAAHHALPVPPRDPPAASDKSREGQ